jgi:hypothetical protein
VNMIGCHSEPESFTPFRINSAEAKNLVMEMEKRLFTRNEILRSLQSLRMTRYQNQFDGVLVEKGTGRRSVRRLRIAIDPRLAERHGPEIHWTWRLLLAGIGWAWEEVSLDSACDVAFVSEPAHAPRARLCIRANPVAWVQPAAYRLGSVSRHNGMACPGFEGEATAADLVQAGTGQVICQRDLIFDVFWLVTGQEERHWPKDRQGFFDLTGTATLREQVPRQALASQISVWLQKTLLDLGCPPPVPRWPHGKRAAASVSHDVDYPIVIRWLEPLRVVARQGWQGLGPALAVLTDGRSHWRFSNWVEMEKRLQTRSAFYFVARQGSLLEYATGTPDPFYDITSKRFRQMFRYLAEEGFEVGLQASYLAYQSREKLAAEKQRLEEVTGQPVVGNHHHYWHLNPNDVEDTLLIHEQVGLEYDSSLVHDRYLGWRRGLSQPFFPFHQAERRELRTLQIPIAWMDDQLFGQRTHNPGDRWELLRTLADRAAEQGGCLLVDVHNYVFDDTLFPGWAQTYGRLWEYLLDRGDFWFGTPTEIAEHWTARYTALVQASRGLREGREQSENLVVGADLYQSPLSQEVVAPVVLQG